MLNTNSNYTKGVTRKNELIFTHRLFALIFKQNVQKKVKVAILGSVKWKSQKITIIVIIIKDLKKIEKQKLILITSAYTGIETTNIAKKLYCTVSLWISQHFLDLIISYSFLFFFLLYFFFTFSLTKIDDFLPRWSVTILKQCLLSWH